MFGKNEVRKVTDYVPDRLLVKEVFPTIQGEGPLTGRPAVFVRLAGCNLRCNFCDTDFSGGEEFTHEQVYENICKHESAYKPLVVITGGEPMLQNITPLVRELICGGFQVQIETAGTLMPDTFYDLCLGWNTNQLTSVVSPKTPRIDKRWLDAADYFKYIITSWNCAKDDGLPNVVEQGSTTPLERTKLARPPARILSGSPHHVYVQPCDDPAGRMPTLDNEKAAVQSARKFGYTLSLQTHKLLGLP